jgi:predicted NUDIX family phosphoesterase
MDEISIEAWIKPDNISTAQTIIDGLSIAPGGSIKADFDGTVHITSGCIVKPGEWNHIVYTSNGYESYIYVNGEIQVPGIGSVIVDADFIGNDLLNATPFDGVIDEISIFRRVLAENEVIANYQNMLNLRAEWLLDENVGTLAEDSSQNTNTGTINGATWTIGKAGYALYFDGIDDDVVIPDAPNLDINGAITVEAWINPDNVSGFKSIISRSEYDHRLLLSGANVYAEFGGSAQATTSSPITAGEWNYIVYTSDGTTSTIYVNGVAESTGTGGANFSSSTDVFIGKTIAGYYRFKGKIDEVKIYERVTSSSEVATKYNNVLNLRAEWPFEENTGTSTEDTSQYTNTGTINGATWSSGEVGYALSFDGVDDYVQISDDPSLDINGAITIEAWIRPHNISTWAAIISRNEYARRLLLGPGGKIQAEFGGTIQTTATGVITQNEWNHVAYSSDGTTSVIYVNGTAVLTGAGGADFNSSTDIFIGKTKAGYYPFDGEIDELKIYGKYIMP